MPICESKIAQDISANCSSPIFAGVEGKLWLFNRSDIATLAVANNVVSADASGLALATGKRGYTCNVLMRNNFEGIQVTLNTEGNRNKVDKALPILIQDDGPDVAKNVTDPLLNADLVAVYERKWSNADGDSKFVMIGAETGAKVTEYSSNPTDAATDGAISVTLTETGAPTTSIFVFKTDAATTRTYLDGLCAEPEPDEE